MNRETLEKVSIYTTIALGTACLLFALIELPSATFSWTFLIVAAFAVFIAPRMTLRLPKSTYYISFSDAAVMLGFLMFGGPAAIIISALESIANCLYLRAKGVHFARLIVPTNVSISVISITCTYLILTAIPGEFIVRHDATDATASVTTQHLITTLGLLGLIHFATASTIVSLITWVRKGVDPWKTWVQNCFTSSMTQIVGAGLAGLVFKLIGFGDLVTGLIASAALAIAYLSYRQSIAEANNAIDQVESAEREKAETERDRREEAERHAGQLALLLEKEERANDALRKSEKDLQHAALHDPLTGLPNRKHFGEQLGQLIEQYNEDPASSFHVMFLDIRRFKDINDSLGHSVGDKVLKVAAKRFVRMLSPKDLVARLGGDEFAVILRDLTTVGKAQKVARRLRDSIAQPFSVGGNRISIGINIGIAPCDTEYQNPEEVLRDADIAMHYAKEKNSGVAVFTKELRVRFLERIRFENDLRHAVDRDELSMSYQPLISLSDGGLLGFEALLRWHHGELGQIPPNKFIPIAEESGLIIPITNWILETTCTQLARWQKISPAYRDLIVSVNISGKHLSNDDLIEDVENALAVSKIKPGSLKLEITESAAMENAEHTISILNRLKAIGVQLSIDDFGTGYSSLSYLHRLPFDTLKIDRSFVYSVGESGENSEILQTIISLAKSLKKRVIAEGIETESQLSLLQNLGCDYGQGYLFAKPQTKENTETSLYESRNWLRGRSQDQAPTARTRDVAELPVF